MFENVTVGEIITAIGGIVTVIFGKDFWKFLTEIRLAYINRKNSNVSELEKKITTMEMECNLKEQENMKLEKENFQMKYKLKNIIPALRIIKDADERNELLDFLDPEEPTNTTSTSARP